MVQIPNGLIQVDWQALKAVIFDVGGVLLRTADHAPRHAWDRRLGLSPGTVEETVFNSELGTAAQLGQVTTEAHWQNIQEHFNLDSAAVARLRRDFWAGDRFDHALARWIGGLRGRYKLAIISNAFDDLRSVLADEWGVADLFDVIVISAEEEVMKPDPAIYERTLARLDCEPQETVFIDDNLANIGGARFLGMGVIHYQASIDLPTLFPPAMGDD